MSIVGKVTRVVLPASVVALLLWLALTGSCPGWDTTRDDRVQVYRIETPETASGKATYNFLFLPAGFAAEQLPAFRLAAASMAEALAQEPPLDDHRSDLAFYRIDVVGGAIDGESCDEPTPLPAAPVETALGSPLHAEDEVAAYSSTGLRVERSASSGACLLLWLDEDSEAEALALADLAPDIRQVIVLANLAEHAGGTTPAGESGSLPLIVIGVLTDEDTDATSGFSVTPTGLEIAIHEVGHGFGLYDSTTGSSYVPSLSFDNDRNLWNPAYSEDYDGGDPGDLLGTITDGALGGDEFLCTDIPWRMELADDCPDGVRECAADSGEEACPYQPFDASGASCPYSSSTPPGLWEGGFYSREGYFRARKNDLMNEVGTGAGFCEACTRVIRNVLCAWIDGTCEELAIPVGDCE